MSSRKFYVFEFDGDVAAIPKSGNREPVAGSVKIFDSITDLRLFCVKKPDTRKRVSLPELARCLGTPRREAQLIVSQ